MAYDREPICIVIPLKTFMTGFCCDTRAYTGQDKGGKDKQGHKFRFNYFYTFLTNSTSVPLNRKAEVYIALTRPYDA